MKFLGYVKSFGARRTASDDKERTITLVVHGSFEGLDGLMDKPLNITIEAEDAIRMDPLGRQKAENA